MDQYTVEETVATVQLGPASIGPIYVLTGGAGVVAYGLKHKLEFLAKALNALEAPETR